MPQQSLGRSQPERGTFLGPLLRPSLTAASYFVASAAVALCMTLSDDHVQGVSAPSVRRLIATRFRGEVLSAGLLALATAALIGLAAGAIVHEVVKLRRRLLGRDASKTLFESSIVVLGLHAFVVALDVATHPQAYVGSLYSRGGVRALVQLGLSSIGAWGVVLVGASTLAIWLGVPLVRRLRSGAGWPFEKRSTALAVSALGALVAIGSCDVPPAGRARAASSAPNVLIIAADSLRADRVEARVAPNLTRLAERGVRFDRAYTPLPRTFPSWVSLLSGRDPHHHGIRHMFPRWEARSADIGAIPGSFARAGRHTAVVSDFAGDIFRRIDLGFRHTKAPTFNIRELVREVVMGGQGPLLPLLRSRSAARALPVLRELHDTTDPWAISSDALREIDDAGERPFFVVAFYSTTHFPYSAPEPFASRFVDRGYRGPFRFGKTPALAAEHGPTEADVRALRASYDGAVAAVDDAVGRLLAGLSKRGLAGNTIVVVTSDHGESLYEPGRGQGHGDHLFGDEATHVPLVVFDPRHPGPRRIPTVVRTTDLAPTLCELAAVPCDSGSDGRSLAPALGGAALEPRLAFAETGLWFTRDVPDVPPTLRMPYPDLTELLEVSSDHDGDLVARERYEPLLVTAKHRMVRDERYKLVYVPTRQAARFLLYDTQADPGETKDVSREHPELTDRLEAELFRWMLEDTAMQRRGDYLVPRPSAARAAPGGTP